MKILHYTPVVFSYLLACCAGLMACNDFSRGIARIQSSANVWTSTSDIVAGLLSLGLSYFLWRWANSVRKNARITLELKQRIGKAPDSAA